MIYHYLQSHFVNEKDPFSDFAESLANRLMFLSKNYFRCDIVSDRYFKNSLKGNIRNVHRAGSRKLLDDNTKITAGFKSDSLKNCENKNDFHMYLAEKISEIP